VTTVLAARSPFRAWRRTLESIAPGQDKSHPRPDRAPNGVNAKSYRCAGDLNQVRSCSDSIGQAGALRSSPSRTAAFWVSRPSIVNVARRIFWSRRAADWLGVQSIRRPGGFLLGCTPALAPGCDSLGSPELRAEGIGQRLRASASWAGRQGGWPRGGAQAGRADEVIERSCAGEHVSRDRQR